MATNSDFLLMFNSKLMIFNYNKEKRNTFASETMAMYGWMTYKNGDVCLSKLLDLLVYWRLPTEHIHGCGELPMNSCAFQGLGFEKAIKCLELIFDIVSTYNIYIYTYIIISSIIIIINF